MEPEEIDRLFKDRLAGLPAMPSADAWSRLQRKMEPPKKENKIWLYYVAASISILLVVGLLFFRNQALISSQQVAVTKPIIEQKIDKPIEIAPEQATENKVAASGTIEAPEFKKEVAFSVAGKTSKIKDNNLLAQANRKRTTAKTAITKKKEQQLVIETQVLLAQENNLPSPDKQVTLALNEPVNIIQVTVKRDNLDELTKAHEESGLRDNLANKGRFLKNIYKQARNLKNGERVELAALGINTERLKDEKNNIKEKINKVIPL